MLVDDLPEARPVGIIRHALVNQADCAVGQRPVNDIGMPGHPAHIRGAPVNLARFVIENQLMRKRNINHVSARAVQHALRFSGRAGGVEDKKRVFGIHLFARAVGRLFVHHCAFDIAPFNPCDFRAGMAKNQNRVNVRAAFQRLVRVGF